MTRKIKLKGAFDINIIGSGDNAKLTFIGNTKNCNSYKNEIDIDDYDIRELIKASMGHFKRVEDEALNRLTKYRKVMNYSNTEAEITYNKPNP